MRESKKKSAPTKRRKDSGWLAPVDRAIRNTLTIAMFTTTALIAADTPYAMIVPKAISESSGLAMSCNFLGVMWTLNDSGDSARIFAITMDGEAVRPENDAGPYKGIKVLNARNVDWEDIAADDDGNLIIGAFGNHKIPRRDLALYVIKEPNPRLTKATSVIKKIRFRYPDQTDFTRAINNFDCEAVFAWGGKYYLLTKHRTNTRTQLYRFDDIDEEQENVLTLVGDYDIGGMVTAADVSTDGKRLAVLTYTAVWVFAINDGDDNFLKGKASRCAIAMGQCEAICFDGNDLIVSSEQRGLYRIKPEWLEPVLRPVAE
ncbi:MAG TPA: hypothetical protein DIT01_14745 [Lentisphaeria bacterium]|nr:hypothetical protein [Lentisphaeria bacterium]